MSLLANKAMLPFVSVTLPAGVAFFGRNGARTTSSINHTMSFSWHHSKCLVVHLVQNTQLLRWAIHPFERESNLTYVCIAFDGVWAKAAWHFMSSFPPKQEWKAIYTAKSKLRPLCLHISLLRERLPCKEVQLYSHENEYFFSCSDR